MNTFIPILIFVSLLCSTAFPQNAKWLGRAQPLEQQFGQRTAVTALGLIHSQNDRIASALACGRADGTVTIFDLKDSRVLTQHNLGKAVPIAFSPRGDIVASLHSEKNHPFITLWDIQSGKELHILSPKGRGSMMVKVMNVAFAPDGSTLAAAIGDFYFQGVELWDVKTGELLRVLERIPGDSGATYGADAVVFSPDGQRIAATSTVSEVARDGDDYRGLVIGIWEVATGKWKRSIKLRRFRSASALAWGSDHGQSNHIVDTNGKIVNAWDADTGEWRVTAELEGNFYHQRTESASGVIDTLLLVSGRGNYFLAGSGSTVTVRSWRALGSASTITSPIPITRAMFINDDTVACGLVDGTVRLWRIQQKQQESP